MSHTSTYIIPQIALLKTFLYDLKNISSLDNDESAHSQLLGLPLHRSLEWMLLDSQAE